MRLIVGALALLLLGSSIAMSPAEAHHGRRVDFGPWNGVVACESEGRAAVISRGTPYHGLFQFSESTWDNMANRRDRSNLLRRPPSQYTVAQQLRQAEYLRTLDGIGHWPVCGRRYGDGTPPIWVTGEREIKHPKRCAKNLRTHWDFPKRIARSVCGA